MKKLSKMLIFLGIISGSSALGQNETDALRYSRNFQTGTARFTAMGGAFGSLGGDFSAITINPAGIGIYRKSEISFTPSVFSNSTATDHYGTKAYGSKANFNFGNAGLVITFNTGESDRWISSNIAFGYNRINNYNSRISVEGTNSESSLLDLYRQQIEAVNFDEDQMDPFGNYMAWYAYLVDTAGGESFTALPNYKEVQRKTIDRSGSVGETFFSFGGNYSNRLYLGGTIGFTRVRFSENSIYTEVTDSKDTTTFLNSFVLTENLSTNGSGVNFKMGMIYRINDFVRFGGAIHSPTYYDLSDTWNSSLDANFKDTTMSFSSPEGLNDYTVSTPFKAIGSMSFIFGKHGLVSMDYEFLDYSLARLSGSGANNYNYSSENQQINEKYTSASNFRIGTEWRLDPFSLRAGYAYHGNPFASGVGNRSQINSYSAGFGIREEGYFIDFGYVLSKGSENYYLYDPALVRASEVDGVSQSFLATFGVRF